MSVFTQLIKQSVLFRLITMTVLLVIGVALSRCIDTEIVGFIQDDGAYLVSAKALATGQGFRLIHTVGSPAQIRYPIFYPLCLMPLWWLFPQSPNNLVWFSWLTVVLSIFALIATDYYWRHVHAWPRWLSCLGLLAISGNFFFLLLGSTVMSESLYLLVSMLALTIAHHWENQGWKSHGFWWLILLSTLTFHTRLIGFCLIVAVSIWLWLKGQRKFLCSYVLITLICTVLPWAFWVKSNQLSHLTPLNFPIFANISDYGSTLIWSAVDSERPWWLQYRNRIFETASDLVGTLLKMLFPVLPNYFQLSWLGGAWVAKHVGAIRAYLILLLLSSYAVIGRFVLLAIETLKKPKNTWTLPGLYLSLYLVTTILWGFANQNSRFLLVVLPLLWTFFLGGLIRKKIIFAAALLCLSAFTAPFAQYSVSSIRQKHWLEAGKAPYLWQEYKSVFAYIKTHTPKDSVIACSFEVPVYLNTGRKTFHVYYNSLMPNQTIEQGLQNLEKSMTLHHVSYLLLEANLKDFVLEAGYNPVAQDLITMFPKHYKLLFISPTKAIALFKRI